MERVPKERWIRLYISTLLIPVGLWCIYLGANRPAAQNSLGATLVVLGAGLVVFGVFGPRMEGRFKIGPSGVEGGLTPTTAQVIVAAHDRIKEAAARGEVPTALEETATRAAIGSSGRRYAYRRASTTTASSTADPTEVGKKLADAILEASKVQQHG
jgi:hypothetical protein